MIEGNMEKTNAGNVTYNKNILLSIVNLAAKEISGVASLSNNFSGSKIAKLFKNSSYFEGVKIIDTADGLIINVYINVYANYNVSDVSCRVQENIKSGISSMTNISVKEINVHVMGVEFQDK